MVKLQEVSRNKLILIRVLLWTLIILLFFAISIAPVFSVLLIIAMIYIDKRVKKELKQRKKPVTTEKETPYIFLRFKVAGVTFNNGRKTRQAILRAFKWGDETLETVDFEQYEYEGRPAVYVKINDQIVGNVPANMTEKFLEHEKLYARDNIHCDIYGGDKLEDGSRKNYGCEIIIRYKKGES